jgi:hypothetical protein
VAELDAVDDDDPRSGGNVSDDQHTGAHNAQPGGISGETLKTVGAIVSILVILAGAVAWASAVKTELSEFRQQYSRDSAAMLRRLDSADEARERVRVLETQRASDEREWRGRGEDIARRLVEVESLVRSCGGGRAPRP